MAVNGNNQLIGLYLNMDTTGMSVVVGSVVSLTAGVSSASLASATIIPFCATLATDPPATLATLAREPHQRRSFLCRKN